MKVGLALPHYGFSFPPGQTTGVDGTIEWARRAEALGFDSVWVSDHFFLDISRYGGPPGRHTSIEPLSALAAIAASTERVRLGTLVLCALFRPPALLAKTAATLDVISDGRLDLGIGAGWYEDEFKAYGYEFPGAGERMARLREVLLIAGGMLAQTPFTFDGRYYQVSDAPNEPQPVQRPRPPLIVGSKGGPRSLGIVAECADGWNTVWRWTPADYAERATELDRLCEKAGRDPATVSRSIGLYTLIGEGAELRERFHALKRWAPGGALDDVTLEQFAQGALVGSASECAARLEEFASLGVGEIIVAPAHLPFALPLPEQLDVIATELIPKVRDVAG